MEPNYSGWASRVGIKCTDGRTISKGAFKGQDQVKVPLLYMHNHTDAKQILGHAVLSHKDEGTWADLYFNDGERAKDTITAIEHGDVDKLSIWAKELDERLTGGELMVHDGIIQEVSVVLAGANSGAMLMKNVLQHADFDEDDLMMVTGEIKHADGSEVKAKEPETPSTTEPEDKTVGEVLATLNEEQQTAVNAFINDVVNESVTEALATQEPVAVHDDLKEEKMNVFDKTKGTGASELPQLKHDDVHAILADAKGPSGEGGTGAVSSLRDLVRSTKGKELMHADTYGIQNLEILFPDAQNVQARPTWVDRRQEWVKKFLGGTSHTPFSRIKTMYADITADEARARGYIRGNKKVEEVFPVFQRTTGPAWIYKRQKLDRQDIIDIVDFDVVAWIKAEMRGKLDEEIARAGLFGDGRPMLLADGKQNPDKILEPTGNSGEGIRSVINDADLYSTDHFVPLASDAKGLGWNVLLDNMVEAAEWYLGSGNKTAFISYRVATRLLTMRDNDGRRVYRNLSEVAGDMDVSSIERVPSELMPPDVLAIVLDLADYHFGTNRGGEITLFDDFDIDFNQYIYLMETYLSGALVLPYAAQIFRRVDPAGTLVATINRPTVADNVVTIPTQTGVVYRRKDTNAVVNGGQTITLNDTNLKQVDIEAFPANGFYFEDNDDRKDKFQFRYKAPQS